MDFEDKYKDYTSTFLVSPELKKSDKNETKNAKNESKNAKNESKNAKNETKNTKNGLIRQNGDM